MTPVDQPVQTNMAPKASGQKSLSTPAVRAFAKQNKVDINQVHGTGNNGRVTRDDIRMFMSGSAQSSHAQQQQTSSYNGF